MGLWLKLALRNAARNIRRSGLTALTVIVATALYTVTSAWIQGMFGGMTTQFTAVSGHIRLVDADFAAREELQPLYENIPDVAPLLEAARATPGVVAAEPRITTGVALTRDEALGEDFALLVGGTDTYYRERLKGPEAIVSGRWLSGKAGEVVLGRITARDTGSAVGEEILLLGQTQHGSMAPINAKVVGVVAGDAMMEQQAFVTLEEAQWMLDLEGGAMEVLVYAASLEPEDVAPVAARLAALPQSGALIARPWYTQDPWAVLVGIIDAVRLFIQLLIVFIASLAIFNTMTMSVVERTEEIGVMRAMGLSGAGAVGLFAVEAAAIGAVGGVLGAALGALPALYLQIHGVTLAEDFAERMASVLPVRTTFYAQLTPDILIQAALLGLVIALLGALIPSMRAASVQPVTAMRRRQ